MTRKTAAELKRDAAIKALEFVEDGMKLGWAPALPRKGSRPSATEPALKRIAEAKRKIPKRG